MERNMRKCDWNDTCQDEGIYWFWIVNVWYCAKHGPKARKQFRQLVSR